MAVYTGYVFMPQHIMAILHYFEVVQWQADFPATFQDDRGFPLAVRKRNSLAGLCTLRLWSMEHEQFGGLRQ